MHYLLLRACVAGQLGHHYTCTTITVTIQQHDTTLVNEYLDSSKWQYIKSDKNTKTKDYKK